MRRLVLIAVLVCGLTAGGWALWNRDRIQGPGDFVRLAGEQLGIAIPAHRADWHRGRPVIRVGSLNVAGLNHQRLSHPRAAAVFAGLVAQFDVLALQQLDARDPWLLKRFLAESGADLANYDVLAGPAQRNAAGTWCNAIVYNRNTIELDRNGHYTVNDPDNLVSNKPQVAWMRTRNVTAESALTFTLVNVRFDPQAAGNEIMQIGPLFRAVRGDGRGEDDVILAGDFGVPAAQLEGTEIGRGLLPLVRYQSTTAALDMQRDNVLIDPLATGEFTGRAGVYDFLKLENLALEEARLVSAHLPVWAEFSAVENTDPGRVAARTGETTSKN